MRDEDGFLPLTLQVVAGGKWQVLPATCHLRLTYC